jgi:CHAD domain-containing protein
MVRREVASRRQALREELADNAPVSDLKKLLKKLERVGKVERRGKREEGRGKKGKAQTSERKIEAQWRGVLAVRLLRRAKALAAALDEAGPVYVPERLHEVRISTKKLRYALEIAADAGVAPATPLVRVLKRHQERLGRLHDLQILLKHVRETEGLPGVGSRVNDLTAYADSLDRECRRRHADFVEHRSELVSVAKEVRHNIVPALTTPPRRQARVAAARPSTKLGTPLSMSKGRRPAVRRRASK